MEYAQKAKERFEAKILPVPFAGCWLWEGSCNADGYGYFKMSGKMIKAHRAAWLLYRGTIPDGLCVLHKCDTPACTNPDHLFVGTDADNAQDRERKQRGQPRAGISNGNARLTESQVLQILADNRSQQRIADEFGIAQCAVSKIKRGVLWKHLQRPTI